MKNRAWQGIECEVLSKMALAGKTDSEIATILGRGTDDVFKTRKRLGIQSKNSNHVNPWTSEELGLLESMFRKGFTDPVIAERLGRTDRSIKAKRESIGLGKDEREVGSLTPSRARTAAALLSMQPCKPHASWEAKAQASTAFLIELLRAGHKPGQGEFHIPSECRVVRPSQLVVA